MTFTPRVSRANKSKSKQYAPSVEIFKLYSGEAMKVHGPKLKGTHSPDKCMSIQRLPRVERKSQNSKSPHCPPFDGVVACSSWPSAGHSSVLRFALWLWLRTLSTCHVAAATCLTLSPSQGAKDPSPIRSMLCDWLIPAQFMTSLKIQNETLKLRSSCLGFPPPLAFCLFLSPATSLSI